MSKYILSNLFNGSFPVTQSYGNNPDYYKQFGFSGHEGVDWGTPTGTPIFSPFDGIVVRDTDDAKEDNYGIKVVIWDPIQKCAVWLCHLESNSVNNGDKVKKGQQIGVSDNTGNTSGPHLHGNFCETDANGNRVGTDNGYKGFLNILDSNLVEWGSEPVTPSELVITDSTKLDLSLIQDVDGSKFGVLEFQVVKSKIVAFVTKVISSDHTIEVLNQKINDLNSQPPVQVPVNIPVPSNVPKFIRRWFGDNI